MEKGKEHPLLGPADILLPRNCDLRRWAVVACDQYTSEPDYWDRVDRFVGDAPSALRLILPEHKLERGNVEEEIQEINLTMRSYLAEDLLRTLPQAMIYVERRLASGRTRQGLVGVVDLEDYDPSPRSAALIRATEGMVPERFPARMALRRSAALELPHVMLLLDDPDREIIEPLGLEAGRMEQLYDFALMEGGGRISGYLLTREQQERVDAGLRKHADPAAFRARYHLTEEAPALLFAVGDGNHSLATAKACYEVRKKELSPEAWAGLPSRYALVEVVNLHDDSLEFEAIHRVCFHVEPSALLGALLKEFPGAELGEGREGQSFRYVYREHEGTVTIPDLPEGKLVNALQTFLDHYLASHGGKVDYVHGAAAARQLGSGSDAMAFLLPAMEKEALFPAIIREGTLPRKTFSMGEANDKRFYLEARLIK